MLLIELPRALEEYFAYAETEPTRKGRRFSITLPFYSGNRLDRMQWWFHVSPSEELMYEGEGVAVFRARATARFLRHIERWLGNTNQRLHGDDAIPHISPLPKAAPAPTSAATSDIDSTIIEAQPLPEARVVNG